MDHVNEAVVEEIVDLGDARTETKGAIGAGNGFVGLQRQPGLSDD